MINIKIGSDGKPNEVTVIVGNKGENLDETLQFEMPSEFVGFHKYLVVVNKKQEETKTMVFPIIDNQLTITYDITKEPGKYSMYVMAREYELETLEGEIVLTPKSYEKVFISDALIGVVNDTEIDGEMFVNENTTLQPTVTVFPKTQTQMVRPKVGFYGLSEVVVKSIYDEDEVPVIPTDVTEFGITNGKYMVSYYGSFLTENEKYKVYWDDAEYECVCQNSDNGLFVGNPLGVGSGDNTIPFTIVVDEAMGVTRFIAVKDTEPTTHKYGLYEYVYRFQTKTVTPTEEQQTIVADDGFYGLEKVIVEPGGGLQPTETVIFDDTYTSTDLEGMFAIVIESTFNFTPGLKYTVNFDGNEYECLADNYNGNGYIGNMLAFGGVDTGEPFVVVKDSGMLVFVVFADTSPTTHTLKVTEIVGQKIVPNGCQLGVYWDGNVDGKELYYPYYKVSDYHGRIVNAYGVYGFGHTMDDMVVKIGSLTFVQLQDGVLQGNINEYPVCIVFTKPTMMLDEEKSPGIYFLGKEGEKLFALVFDGE